MPYRNVMAEARIASLLAAGTEIVCALGLADRLVAISHECDFPPEVLHLPRITRSRVNESKGSAEIDAEVRSITQAGESLFTIDTKQLLSVRPNLIVTQSQCDVCAVGYDDLIGSLASIPSLTDVEIVTLHPSSLKSVFDDIRSVSAAAGSIELADVLCNDLNRRIDDVRSKTEHLREHQKPRVACLEWLDPPMVAANWMPEIVQLAGGSSGLATAGAHTKPTTWSSIINYDPEVVIVMPCGFDVQKAAGEAHQLDKISGWSQVSAVQDGRVFAADGNAYFNRSGPRLVDSLEKLAPLIQPSLFTAAASQEASHEIIHIDASRRA